MSTPCGPLSPPWQITLRPAAAPAMRSVLNRAAQAAAEGGFEAFTSSLFISPLPKSRADAPGRRGRCRGPSPALSVPGFPVPSSAPVRTAPGSWDCICRNTAAASSPRRSATASRSRSSAAMRCSKFIHRLRPPRMSRGGHSALDAAYLGQGTISPSFYAILCCNFMSHTLYLSRLSRIIQGEILWKSSLSSGKTARQSAPRLWPASPRS